MLSKSFLSVMIVTSAFTLVFGQTPEAKKDVDNAPKAFAFSFNGGGSYLGVQTQEVNKENFAKFGLKEVLGVAVEKVMENSPAAAAGLQAGDVIVRFGDMDVKTLEDLTFALRGKRAGDRVTVVVRRGGQRHELEATLEERR